jgi:hypothetical protein
MKSTSLIRIRFPFSFSWAPHSGSARNFIKATPERVWRAIHTQAVRAAGATG